MRALKVDEEQMECLIRIGTFQDIDEMTRLHLASFSPETHIPMEFGNNYVRATYKWLVSSGISYALVAEIDNRIKGVIGVCDGPFTSAMFKACWKEFLVSLAMKPTLLLRKHFWKRVLKGFEINKDFKAIVEQPGFAQMTIGAVDENSRGLGIFPRLVRETINESRERGSWGIRAGVYKTNKSSRRVFIKEGWEEFSELETEDTVFYYKFIDSSMTRLIRKR